MKRRIVRTLLTAVALGVLMAAAFWHRSHEPLNASAVAATARHEQQIASCEAQIRPRLQGEIDGWRLVDEQLSAQGKQFTFAANVNEQTALYHCVVGPTAMVLAVEGPE